MAQFKLFILEAPFWMEAPWLPSSQHVGRCSSSVSQKKGPHHGCLGQQDAQGSAITAFNPLAAQRCTLCQQGFSPQSVRQC